MKDITILRKFEHEVHKGFKPTLPVKLNQKEVELLVLLENKPERPMHWYGHHVRLEKGSFTYLVDLLEAKELITRVQDDEDKRKRSLSLSDKGKELSLDIQAQHHIYIDNRYSCFTEEEQNELDKAIEVFEKLLPKLPEVPKRGPKRGHGKGRGGKHEHRQ